MSAPDEFAGRRVVLDSNVLISAFLFGGQPKIVLDLAYRGAIVPITSAVLKLELTEVLERKFKLTSQQVATLCGHIWDVSFIVEPKHRFSICRDEADNRVLECAVEGRAHSIVTGDRDLLDLGTFRGIAIVQPVRFLASL